MVLFFCQTFQFKTSRNAVDYLVNYCFKNIFLGPIFFIYSNGSCPKVDLSPKRVPLKDVYLRRIIHIFDFVRVTENVDFF